MTNKLDKLINELCPDGVEYRTLGEVLDYEQPTKYIVHSTDYNDTLPTPILTAGQTFILGFTDETDGIYKASKQNPVIIFDDFTTANKWVDFEFKVKSSAMKILKSLNDSLFNIRYIYYCIQCITYRPVDHSRQWIAKYSKITIPLPPLPIQEEIVRILDNFTELTAELTARKKQYEYYRDELLTFDDSDPRVKLWEIATITRGNGLQKSDFSETGFPCIHYGQIYTFYKTSATQTKSFIPLSIANKLKKVYKGDIIIAVTSENVEDICKCVVWLGDEEIVTGGHTAILKHKQNAKYIAYWLQTKDFFSQKTKIAHGTKVIEIKPSKLSKITIPLPSLSAQERIVNLLDRFDALCNDISIGLPAEIKARKQQYEYYRDKLLTFKERVA